MKSEKEKGIKMREEVNSTWRREEEKSQAQRNGTKRTGKWMGIVWGRWQTGEKGARKKYSKEENKTKRSGGSEREESEIVCGKEEHREWGENERSEARGMRWRKGVNPWK